MVASVHMIMQLRRAVSHLQAFSHYISLISPFTLFPTSNGLRFVVQKSSRGWAAAEPELVTLPLPTRVESATGLRRAEN